MTWLLRSTVNRVSRFTGKESEEQKAQGLSMTWNKFLAHAYFSKPKLGVCDSDIPSRHIEFSKKKFLWRDLREKMFLQDVDLIHRP